MQSGIPNTSAAVLAALWPGEPTWAVAALAGAITFLAGLLSGLYFNRKDASGPSKSSTPRLPTEPDVPPTAYRYFRILSGPVSGTLGGAALGYYLGGVYGQFAGYPLGGLGFGIGIGLGAGGAWAWWRATFIAGWIGSWVAGVMILVTTPLLPVGLQSSLRLDALVGGLPVPELGFSALVGILLSLLTTNKQGWTVGLVSDANTSAAAMAIGTTWLVLLLGISAWTLGSLAALRQYLGWIFGVAPEPISNAPGSTFAVELAAFVSLLIASVVVPRALNRHNQNPTTGKPGVGFPTGIHGFWRVAPGGSIGAILGLTGVAAFVINTRTLVPSWTDLGLVVGVFAVVGMIVNFAATPSGPEKLGWSERVAFFQTTGSLLYGIVTAVSATGVVWVVLEFYSGRLSSSEFLSGLALGVVLAIVLIGAFLAQERRHRYDPSGRNAPASIPRTGSP